MNIDTAISAFPANNVGELQDILTAPFLGFMVGTVLFGTTILQAYQYYLNYAQDLRARKLIAAAVCISDAVHFGFSTNMVYTSLTKGLGNTNPEAVRSLKVMAVTQTFLTVLVQSFYLYLIWTLAGNILLKRQLSRAVKSISFMTFIYALGIAAVFLAYAMKISSLYYFPASFEKTIYIAFISIAVIDSGIALTVTLVLFKTKSGTTTHCRGVVQFLVFFFVGTGLLTAVASVVTMILIVRHPTTVFYLASIFPMPRLYANSILAMFNAKSRLKKNMECSQELRISGFIFFGDLENDPSEEAQNSRPT